MSAEPHGPSEAGRTLVLWFGGLGGPLAWFVPQQALYVLNFGVATPENRLPLHVASAVALLTALAAVAVSRANWRAVGGWPADADEGRPARLRFLSVLGMLAGSLFALVIVAQWIAVVMLDPYPW